MNREAPDGLEARADAADRGLDPTRQALLNLLEDAVLERGRMVDTQRAVTNIFEDIAAERLQTGQTQRALMNLLEDMAQDSTQAAGTQRAVVNILEDMAAEKARLEGVQRAMVNLLEDFDAERSRAESQRRELAVALESVRQARDAAEKASRELDAFAYSVAHDLRAPLRAIDGFGHLLLKQCGETLDPESRRMLDRILAGAKRMALLIDDLLTLSRVMGGERNVHDVSITDLARAVLARHQAANPGRAVTVEIADGLQARGDGRLLEIVLDNLLGNAFKFTRRAEAARVEVGSATADGRRAFFVRDNGAGFSMEYAGNLFQPFKRLHRADEFEGTGIGLAIVARIVDRHGGRVWAQAEVGRGATLWFTLEDR